MSTEASTPTETREARDNRNTRDTIFIGKKPLMAYVTSTLIQLANLPSVNIKCK